MGFLEQVGVDDRHRHLIGEGGSRLLRLLIVEIFFALAQRDHADHVALANQRGSQPTTDVFFTGQRVRPLEMIDRHGAARFQHLPQSFVRGNGNPERRVAGDKAARPLDHEVVAVAPPQRHHVVADHALHFVERQRPHLVAVERSSDAAGNLRQRGKLVRAGGDVLFQPRALGHVLDQQHDAAHTLSRAQRIQVEALHQAAVVLDHALVDQFLRRNVA